MKKLLSLNEVKLASEVEPELNRCLEGRKIERVEWHDGHGDVIEFDLDDGTVIGISAPYPEKLRITQIKDPRKSYE